MKLAISRACSLRRTCCVPRRARRWRKRAKWRDIISPVRGGVTGSCVPDRISAGIWLTASRPRPGPGPPASCDNGPPGVRIGGAKERVPASRRKSRPLTAGRSSEHSTAKVAPSVMESVVIDAVRRCCATSGAKSPLAAAEPVRAGRGIARHVKRAADHIEDDPAGECHLRRQMGARMTDRDGDGAVDEAPSKAAISARGSGKAAWQPHPSRRLSISKSSAALRQPIPLWKLQRQRGRAVEDDGARRAGIAQRIQQRGARPHELPQTLMRS